MKKILSLVLALCMVLTIGAAFADPSESAKDVKVTGLDNGDEVTFYNVVKWVGETSDNSDVTGWKATEAYASVLTKEVLTQVLLGTAVADTDPVKYANPTGITPELANALAKINTTGSDPVTADESGEATLANAEPGIYMALVKPVDVDTVYNPIFVSVDFNGANNQAASTYADSTAKKSTLTLKKTAANADDYNGDNGQTAAVGDVISYTVKATIPAYGAVYTNPYFAVKDTLVDLTLDTTSIKVDGDSSSSNWSVTQSSASGYTIEFAASYLKTIKTATEVTITYNATVATTAKKIINEESNDVMIEFSHDPSNENDHDVKKDTTQHYTFSIDAEGLSGYTTLEGEKGSEVVKIGKDANGDPINQTTEYSKITKENSWTGPLDGAQFGLWKNDKCEGEAFKTATTDAAGRMNFAGLDAGTYYLKEISAPAGFVTNSDIHTIVLTAEVDKVNVTEYWNGTGWVSSNNDAGTLKSATYETEILKSYSVKIDGVDVATYTFTNASTSNSNEIKWTTLDPVELPCQLVNTQGVELPHTGGIGTTIFYILGGLLVVGAAIILVARRKADEK
jgi:LPXTG-motif cell wall-anchored protein